MIITESTSVWVIFFATITATVECATKTDQPDRGLRYNVIDSPKEDSTAASEFSHIIEEDETKVPVVIGGSVHRQTSPLSITNTADEFAAADGNGVREFLDAHTDTREDYDDEMGRVLSRDRRALTFPAPSTLLLIFGLGTPLQLDRESVIIGMFTKMIYALPTNSTDFTEPGVYFARTKSRWSIYKVLETAAELYGFGAGKGCLLRAICEVAAAPFDLHHGLFGQMVQAFLSPSSTNEPYDEYTDREYHAAESLGKHVGENCHALYPECERSVLDVFSTTAAMLEEAATTASTSTATTTSFTG